MDLKEAYEVIKKEWHAAERKVKKLEKELEKLRKEGASDSRVQKLLSQIQGLNKKISQYKSLADRYQELYEKELAKVKELENDKFNLELENQHLRDKLEFLEEGSSEEITASNEAEAQIAALKDEVARLTARLNNNGTNTGTPTSRTAIDQKKVIPNSRENQTFPKADSQVMRNMKWHSFLRKRLLIPFHMSFLNVPTVEVTTLKKSKYLSRMNSIMK